MTVLTFPWPPKELTPNFKRRKHWSAYRGPTKAYREQCGWITKAAQLRAPADGLIYVAVTFLPPDRRRRDDDGMIGAFKAGRDGIADAMGLDDNRFRPSYTIGEPVKGGAVVVVLS